MYFHKNFLALCEMKVSVHQQKMKVWVVLAALACWISTVEPQCFKAVTEKEHKRAVYKVRFTTKGATRNSYLMFMKDLYNALKVRANITGDIPVLPPPSAQPTDPEQYLLVELSNGYQNVTLALNISNVYILGYRPGGSGSSYFFSDVPIDARNVFFPNTHRESLPFTGRYGALEAAAGVSDRRKIPLGIDKLRQHIDNMNYIQPSSSGGPIARALIVCIQMVSEAVRLRNIEKEILEVAEPRADGTYGVFCPDGLLMKYENNWGRISSAIQSATNGIFTTPIRLEYDRQTLVLNTTRQVLFIIAIMPLKCRDRGANLELLHMPASISSYEFSSLLPIAMRSIGLEDNDDDCERVLAPTSYIIGQNGLCVDVYQGSYHDGNKIILSECGQNQANQLWTLRTDDNTIRSGGKCLTTYGYSSGSYVMIYDCDTAVSDVTKWKIRSDGSIRNPESGLVLTVSKDSSGMINLVLDNNFYGSRQAWYASNNSKPSVTTIVGYNGLCLLASGSQVWLQKCVGEDAEQWAIYPDETIRPQKNRDGCLKYANAGGDLVTVGTCDGWIEERWRFQSDGTILHVVTEQVMDVKDTGATLPEITVNYYSDQRLSQIWFQVPM
ncbi:abrin-b-like [Durio zibethinus]|uniref:Ribosome-inactivating protein n=1 Tax=Durio zibethinus TaxID=66656 RepID=A0A6P5YJI1_DURZI|nr:abrin-b-like [Durio zibethinus]